MQKKSAYVKSWKHARWEKDPRTRLYDSSKNSARVRNLEHTITLNDIVIPTNCPVFGIKLKANGQQNASASIDRKDNTKGYIPGNVRVISLRANRLKQDATLEELEAIVAYMRND